jgi:8-oxo-dGTP pyrophosphatase MutT (NUDIX family)
VGARDAAAGSEGEGMSMKESLDEYRKKKIELEEKIESLIKEFMEETGVEVIKMKYEYTPAKDELDIDDQPVEIGPWIEVTIKTLL